MTKKLTLDVRGLACPEPVEVVLKAADTLVDGQYLEVIHHQEPRLLYQLLQKRGLDFLLQTDDEPLIKILIWRQQDKAAKDAVDATV